MDELQLKYLNIFENYIILPISSVDSCLLSAKNSFGVRSGAGVGPGIPGRERYLLLHSAAIPEKRPLRTPKEFVRRFAKR